MIYDEYTVALDSKTGKKVSMWRGHRFRNYDETKVRQYKVQGNLNETTAVEQAIKLWELTTKCM